MGMQHRLALFALAGVTALSAVFIACGDDDDDDADGGGDSTPAATAATTPGGGEATAPAAGGGDIDISGVPELEDGTLNIGSDIAYAPIEFLDESNQPVGLDIDLANAIGELLGVEVTFENAAFDGLLPALDAERYDAIMSAMTANDERKEQVDFVEYFNAGSGIVVATGNPEGITSIEDLCGLRVAVQEGTVQVEYLETQGTACTDGGEDAIEILRFPSDPEAVQALLADQADAEMADFPVVAYSATQNEGEIEVVTGYQFDAAPYGIAVRKTSTELRDVLQEALDTLIENGTYAEVLETWNLADGAIE